MPKSPRSKHKSKHKPAQSSSALFLNVPKELRRIDDLIADGDFDQAIRDIKDLAERAPHRADVFEAMLMLSMKTNDPNTKLEAVLRLVELQPYMASHHFNLFVVYVQNHFPALALQTGRYFLSRWPDSKLGKDLPKLLEALGASAREQPFVAQFPGESWIDIFALYDRVVLESSRGNYEHAVAHATQLLSQAPNFIPAYNNRALAYWLMGESGAALADTNHVLELEPDNFHALGNLARFLRLENRLAEARAAAERLKAVPSPDLEILEKQAETFTYFSDDEAVLIIAAQAEADGVLAKDSPSSLLLNYYAGVAAARLGDEKKARDFLNQALEHSKFSRLARQQLQDLDKPVGERDGSGALTLDHWIPRRQVQEFMQVLESATRATNPEATKAAAQKYLTRHPNLTALVPVLLERGDPITRALTQQLARLADTPEMWQALKGFAFSAHGPDHVRNQALTVLQEAGQLAKGQAVTFWSRGKPTEINAILYAIDDVPYEPILSPNISQGLAEARVALLQNEPQRAEEALQRALQSEPASANLQYHLALVYLKKGRIPRTRELAEQLVAQHPNFASPRCQLALIALANDHKEKAREHITSLAALEHFHHLEYVQFCRIQVLFHMLVDADHEAAKHWIELWEMKMPNEPQVKAAWEALKNRLASKQWARQTLANFRE